MFIFKLVLNFVSIYFYYIIKLKNLLNPIKSMTWVARGPRLIQSFIVLIFFKNCHLEICLKAKSYFYRSSRLYLELSNRLIEVDLGPTWFNWMLELGKELNWDVSKLIHLVRFNNTDKKFFMLLIFFYTKKKLVRLAAERGPMYQYIVSIIRGKDNQPLDLHLKLTMSNHF
jgi:hypothetical protein